MTSPVFVTGISGFLAGHVALRLLRRGHAVRGSLRDPTRAEAVSQALREQGADVGRLQFCRLDLTQREGWDAAVAGCRQVLHIASPFVLDMPREASTLIHPAVHGTHAVVAAALKAGVERIVLTSSLAAIDAGHGSYAQPLTADSWTETTHPGVNAYARSKTLAEQEAWRLVRQGGRESLLSVIHPGTLAGPLLGDDPGPSGALIQRLIGGGMPWAPDLFLSYVDVEDVADAHLAAMEQPQAGGRRHVLATGPLSLWEVAQLLRRQLPDAPLRLPGRRMPHWMSQLVSIFDRSLRDNREYLGVRRRYDASSGIGLLGRPLRAPGASLERMARSLIERRLLAA